MRCVSAPRRSGPGNSSTPRPSGPRTEAMSRSRRGSAVTTAARIRSNRNPLPSCRDRHQADQIAVPGGGPAPRTVPRPARSAGPSRPGRSAAAPGGRRRPGRQLPRRPGRPSAVGWQRCWCANVTTRAGPGAPDCNPGSGTGGPAGTRDPAPSTGVAEAIRDSAERAAAACGAVSSVSASDALTAASSAAVKAIGVGAPASSVTKSTVGPGGRGRG